MDASRSGYEHPGVAGRILVVSRNAAGARTVIAAAGTNNFAGSDGGNGVRALGSPKWQKLSRIETQNQRTPRRMAGAARWSHRKYPM